uniref:Uncharacterized protein n=1 Tax=Rhizophora mucronata TaxID=61149 RepID=A0A2P2QQN6_RHIMU
MQFIRERLLPKYASCNASCYSVSPKYHSKVCFHLITCLHA